MFLVRKITMAKWRPRPYLPAGAIQADAISVDLRTNENRLSFWKCATDSEEHVADAALAIAAAGNRIDKIQVVVLEDRLLRDLGLTLMDSEGRTPIEDLKSSHTDVVHLDYARLGEIAGRVAEAARNRPQRLFERERIFNLIQTAADQNRVNRDDLPEGIRSRLSP